MKPMNLLKNNLLFLSFILLFLGCSFSNRIKTPPSNLQKLQNEIDYLISDPNLQNAHIGIYIESLGNGKTIYRKNEHRLFVPASNMKLYTTAASLIKLKPSFQFSTLIYTDGKIVDDELSGNLIIRGKGDPTNSGRFRGGDIIAYFKDWADSLKQRGITKIEGGIIGDESYFTDNKLGKGWSWDDEPYYYSAQTGALSFNDNCVDIKVQPSITPDDSVKIFINPNTKYVKIKNMAKTVDTESPLTLDFTRNRASNVIKIFGNLPLGSQDVTESITIEDPARFFVTVFYEVLRKSGIEITETPQIQKIENYHNLDTLFIYKSPDMAKIIKEVNKRSNNFYAEQMLKTLGSEFLKNGSAESGVKVVDEWLSSIGISPNEFIMVDGSGLSRMNLIAPYATADLLRYMYNHPNFKYYYDSLPIGGIDGTLKERMRGSRAKGNVHAKTGFVEHVRNLSGYLYDFDGKPYLFVIMVNNYSVPVSYINSFQDRICILLSNYREN
jgi:D-alanyl-D-alanine carboxypeptidase/D-alanyl-D-alanine-endopeptidase (penicillin-binding protein 4)